MARSRKLSVQDKMPVNGLVIRGEHFYQVTVGKMLVSIKTYRSFL